MVDVKVKTENFLNVIWKGDAEKEVKDKRLDLALDRLHGKISNLQDRVDSFSRELQEWIWLTKSYASL